MLFPVFVVSLKLHFVKLTIPCRVFLHLFWLVLYQFYLVSFNSLIRLRLNFLLLRVWSTWELLGFSKVRFHT